MTHTSLLALQLQSSKTLTYFDEHAKKHYGFVDYHSRIEPVVFYGCYYEVDITKIKNHSGKKYLIWGGADIKKDNVLNQVKKIPNLIHIAQSSFIRKVLNENQVRDHYYLPFAPTIDFERFKPEPKGAGIYIYTSAVKPEYYGANFYRKIMKRYPNIQFYVTSSGKSIAEAKRRGIDVREIRNFKHEDIHKIYGKCFLGLRLIKHDGISASVQEMGLMGIKTIHNGCTPSSINYRNLDHVYKIIEQERKKIGQTDHDLARKVREHLDINVMESIRQMA